MKLEIEIRKGSKIWFEEETQCYTVEACNKNFAILTKPMNALKTYLYTIIDKKRGERNKDNLVFGFPEDYKTESGSKLALEWLSKGEMEISSRRPLPLRIKKIQQ